MNAEALDEKIRQEIQFELRWAYGVEPGSVGVAVEGGFVTLSGHVPDPSAWQMAERLTRRVLGVRAVANEIQVNRSMNDDRRDVGLVRAVVDAFGPGR